MKLVAVNGGGEMPTTRDRKPWVSVIIPAYNASASISTALDSVLAQTFPDYEIIVINDGSPDTKALEAALGPYRSHIRYITQENCGPSAARNRGIVEARGQYVAFLDSDDFWMPGHLDAQMEILRSDRSLGLVYGDSLLVRTNGVCIGRTFERELQVSPVTFDALLEELCTVSTSTAIASRKALMDAGLFDEQLVRCEDFDLWLRMAFRGTNMTHHPQVNVCRTVSSSGLSSNDFLMKCSRIEVLAKVESCLPLSPDQRKLCTRRRTRYEALADLDRVKYCMQAGEFENALDAATRASSVLHSWKLSLTVSGLRRAPGFIRAYYRVHQQLLAVRNRRRAARSAALVPELTPWANVNRSGYRAVLSAMSSNGN
jgi:glycosyltransferase involved in cell wall biosynthesis